MHKSTDTERRAILQDAYHARKRGDHALATMLFALVGIQTIGGGK